MGRLVPKFKENKNRGFGTAMLLDSSLQRLDLRSCCCCVPEHALYLSYGWLHSTHKSRNKAHHDYGTLQPCKMRAWFSRCQVQVERQARLAPWYGP